MLADGVASAFGARVAGAAGASVVGGATFGAPVVGAAGAPVVGAGPVAWDGGRIVCGADALVPMAVWRVGATSGLAG